jgi:raffinose/stachyose/melibiose transport system substrate-binding protein
VAHRPISRRNFLNLAAGAGAGMALAACGSSGPGDTGGDGGGEATYWYLTGAPGEQIRGNTVKRFNDANSGSKITGTAYENDAYKTKIRTAIGANQAPTIIWGWGGGGLKSWVEAGAVEDLTGWFGENAALKDKLFPSSFGAATVDGKIYAMPAETVEPIVLFYDKRAFDKIKARPPESWGEIMSLVPKFNAAGIAPFSLAGQSRWTNMMWLEFLFDRIGGPEVFQAVFDGEKDAWSHPAALDALTKMQELIRANGFIRGFSSVVADANADQALLTTGKAAMMVHGTWTYGSMKEEGGNFVSGGNLGYMNFPPVETGKGDPSNTVGNPGQYLSISSKASAEQKETAKKFFSTAVLSDAESAEWLDTGGVPIIKGSETKIASSKEPDFLNFVYETSSKAKVFAQSWDQALSPTAAEQLLDNIAKLFQLSISPQQYVDNMNKVIGQ